MATYVYKYIHPKYKWLYVGKSDTNLRGRINAHKTEHNFKPFLKECEIYYIQLDNKAQSKAVESYLIDKYKPHLNTADKYEGESNLDMMLPEWIPYKLYKKIISIRSCV